jgi:prolipoprotein diacylglyceryltransferase
VTLLVEVAFFARLRFKIDTAAIFMMLTLLAVSLTRVFIEPSRDK